ncbi:MAG: LEA type 2 family protein [Deltaproteobacteria bacterium]
MFSAPPRSGFALSLALLLCALAGCAQPQPPAVTPEVARVVRVTREGVELQVTLSVKNPNAFALDAQEVDGTLIVEGGHKLGTGRSRPNHSIPAKGSSSVESHVNIAWDDVPSLQPFLSRESLPYTFKGHVTLGGDTLNVTLPFEMQGKLTREQLLQAGLRGLFDPR